MSTLKWTNFLRIFIFLVSVQGSGSTGLSKGDMICVTDLGFSRSVTFGALSALKTPTAAVVGLGLSVRPLVRASVLAGPALEVVRVCVFYALVQAGVAVPSSILRGICFQLSLLLGF